MTLPAETLKLIQDTARAATMPRIVPELNTDGRSVHVLVAAGEPPRPVVWHGPAAVVLVIDDADRRDRVAFPLTLSERFACLGRLAREKPWHQQAEFIRLLRIDLLVDPLIVMKFRKLDWDQKTEGSGEVRHGRERLGNAIMAQVQGIEELPEDLDISAPVYQQPGERREYLVRCAVEIDVVNRRFALRPVADEIERVIDLAQADIGCRLESLLHDGQGPDVPIYYGHP